MWNEDALNVAGGLEELSRGVVDHDGLRNENVCYPKRRMNRSVYASFSPRTPKVSSGERIWGLIVGWVDPEHDTVDHDSPTIALAQKTVPA